MSGCARSNEITGDLLSSLQAWCNKVQPYPSCPMFTLEPGCCLISPATFFASPLLTAAFMTNSKYRTKLTLRVERRKKEGETVFLTLTCVSGCCVCVRVRVRVRVIVCHSFVWRETRFSSATDNNKTRDTGGEDDAARAPSNVCGRPSAPGTCRSGEGGQRRRGGCSRGRPSA